MIMALCDKDSVKVSCNFDKGHISSRRGYEYVYCNVQTCPCQVKVTQKVFGLVPNATGR